MKNILKQGFNYEKFRDFSKFPSKFQIDLICIFYDLFDNCLKIEKSNTLTHDITLIKALSMKKLILKSNDFYNKCINNENIRDKISYLKELDIVEEVTILSQYLLDYLTINHVEKDLFINEDECINEYCSFLELKELLFNEHLNLKQWTENFTLFKMRKIP